MKRLALVTGAGGYIGTALCRELCVQGWRVRATVRNAGAVGTVQCVVLLGVRLALPRGLRDWDVDPDPRLRALGWIPAHTLETVPLEAATRGGMP